MCYALQHGKPLRRALICIAKSSINWIRYTGSTPTASERATPLPPPIPQLGVQESLLPQ